MARQRPRSLYPSDMAIDAAGNVYVTNGSYSGGSAIAKLDSTGKYLSSIGSLGSNPGQVARSNAVAVAPNGNVYVADLNNSRVLVFDASGSLQCVFGSIGSGEGQFGTIGGMAIDADGNVYVTDSDYQSMRVQKFDPHGKYISQFGSFGPGDGQFYGLHSIAVAR